MGMFGRDKSQEQRTEEGIKKLEKIAAGKGLGGKLAGQMMGRENIKRVQQGVDAIHSGQAAAAAAASGMPSIPARVTALSDTGQVVNWDPVVDLTVVLEDGRELTLRTVVSKVQIPRAGDAVQLFQNPQDPSGFSFGGFADG